MQFLQMYGASVKKRPLPYGRGLFFTPDYFLLSQT